MAAPSLTKTKGKEARAVRASDTLAAARLTNPYAGTYWDGGKVWSDWHADTMHGGLNANRPHTPTCSPAIQERMRRWDVDEPGFHIRARAICLGCDYIGPERTRESEADGSYDGAAWFDALDHVFPGWRETPAIVWPGWSSEAKAPCYMSGAAAAKVAREWTNALLSRGYPREWIGRKDAPTRFLRPLSDDPAISHGRNVIDRYGPWENLAVYFRNPANSARAYAPRVSQDALDFNRPAVASDLPDVSAAEHDGGGQLELAI